MRRVYNIVNRLKFVARSFSPLAILCSVVLLAGCGKSDKMPAVDPNAGLPPEAVAVRQAFESAPPSFKNPVDETLRLVRAGQTNPMALSEALPQLQKLAANPNITAEQKQALETLIQKIQAGGIKAAPQQDVH